MNKKAFIWPFLFILFANMQNVVKAEGNTQNPLHMEELTVQVMPEYAYHPKNDQKNHSPLLVGYHGALINQSEEPQKGQIEIPVPIGEENFQLGFVADYSSDLSEMNEIEYELDKEAGTISWTTSTEIQPQELYRFVIEYYTDSIAVEKDSFHSLEYHFESFSDIGLFNLIFVEPLSTDSFKLEPAAESHQKNSYNMNMFIYMAQGLKAGEEKNIQLEYERGEKRTTAEIMEDMVGGTQKQGTTTKNEEKISVWMIVLVVGGFTLIAASSIIFFLKKKPTNNGGKHKLAPDADVEVKKAKLRSMLVDGKITKEEYTEMLKKVGGN